ncbi:LysR family transcriptional regulator [Longimicrobium terrae]|uniref:DNA-binding transcriptional LysR family regulator n=1 Tax=Longimicrobium terrae TaxID=1639882 RepID=A0A841H374_9BACT|nr:LysR family transcriptional regulator [Longimicrobium terrae]MBB4637856.1 DNA-binding transcriptional LysR family regulator [Longimicrobium terrae]MBB6072289.1 DNA-binding transcriptional LysR family regulator [Longimicrobium terrae]NNC31211.1 LysR family transcriptional regulator [Longimicrobium terrae]
MNSQLDGIEMFVAVVEAGGFRAAGKQLGVSGAAVSQALRRLEERLGVALVQRTTRSVRLTQAGERLYAAVRPALREVQAAIVAVGEMADRPRGMLRLNVSSAADGFLSGATLGGFLKRFPEVRLDITVSNQPADIVARGYDAGVWLGEVIDQDMITVPVSEQIRLIVVGTPGYFARHPAPAHPRDLAAHECLNWRPGSDQAPYRWEFTENGHDFSVAFEARVVTNEPVLNLRLALAGVGLALAREEVARPYIERGELVAALEEFSTPFPGFYLYYPARRQASPALRALIDYLLQLRQSR